MDVRHLTLEETIALEKVQSVAFVYPIDLAALEKEIAETPEKINFGSMWGCFTEQGTLVSGLEDTQFDMRYDGHTVKMGGIGGVASLPEGRMQGGIRAIFEKVFAENRQNGVLFSTLYAFSHPYYRQFGYEICYEGRQVRFPLRSLKAYKQAVGAVRMHVPGEDASAFAPVYQAFASRYNLAVVRGAQAWKRMLRGDPYKAEAYRYILSSHGKDVAYCMFRLDEKSKPGTRILSLFDYAFDGRDALWALLGFLYKLSAQYELVQLEVPGGLEMAALLDEAYELEHARTTRVMARVLDVKEALTLMWHPQGSGQYTLYVEDAFLPENTGAYVVRFEGGQAEVMRTDATEGDLALSVQALAQLCLGYLSLDMALLKRDVTLHANHDTLSRVFVRKDAYLSDRY